MLVLAGVLDFDSDHAADIVLPNIDGELLGLALFFDLEEFASVGRVEQNANFSRAPKPEKGGEFLLNELLRVPFATYDRT